MSLSIRRGLPDLAPPTIAFICATFVLLAATVTAGISFFEADTWAHWDSAFYEAIATKGYETARCAAPQTYNWCGDAGWFPGYAAFLAPVYALGLPRPASGVIVSWLFDYADLVLLWQYFLKRAQSPLRYVALAFAACGPGGVYMRAEFPMATTVSFMLISLIMLQRRRWMWAALAAGVAGFCYPTALLLAPALALWVLVQQDRTLPPTRRAVVTCAAGLLALGGLIATCLLQLIQTGHRDAYFLQQRGYRHGLHLPSTIWWPLMHSAFAGVTGWAGAEAWEAVMVTLVCSAVIVNTAIRALKRTATRWDALMVGLLLMLWLLPLTQANESIYRGDTLLTAPLALMITKLKAASAVLLTGAAVAVYALLAVFVLNGTVV
jgi:hypothetical protein